MIKQPKNKINSSQCSRQPKQGKGEQTLFAQSADTGTQLWHFFTMIDFPQNFCQSTNSRPVFSWQERRWKKILVIQDDAQTRDLFLEGIKAEGFHTIGAENGLVGIQQVQEKSPDVIICDIAGTWWLRRPECVAPGSYYSDYPAILLLPTRIRWPPQSYGLGADDYLKAVYVKELLASITAVWKTDRPPAVLGGWRPKVPERHLLILQAWRPQVDLSCFWNEWCVPLHRG